MRCRSGLLNDITTLIPRDTKSPLEYKAAVALSQLEQGCDSYSPPDQ
jgi:hypothetical protein